MRELYCSKKNFYTYDCNVYLGILAKKKSRIFCLCETIVKSLPPPPTLNPKIVFISFNIRDFVILHFSRFENHIYFAAPRFFSHSTKSHIFHDLKTILIPPPPPTLCLAETKYARFFF